nr:MFS transporter [Tessaracoccus coleopterorum]
MIADIRPLSEPHFRRLWTANIVTVIGAQLTVVAVPAQIYAITGSSGMVGLTGVFGLVPLIVFGLWGGALADHVDRRRLLEITTLGLVATSALFWLQAFLGLGNVWLLLALFSLQQAFFAVNQPTRVAILPKLIPLRQLPAANALNMTVMSAGAIAGPLVGGALIPVLGYSWLYLIDTFTLLATLYAVYRLPRCPLSGAPAARGCARWWRGCGISRAPDPAAQLPGRPDRHGVRHVPRALSRDRARRVRRARRGRARVRAVVCRDAVGRGARRRVQWLGDEGAVAGRCGAGGHLRVGRGDGPLRPLRRAGPVHRDADARRLARHVDRGRRRGHGVRSLPADHPALRGRRRCPGRLQGVFIVVVAGGPASPMPRTVRPRSWSARPGPAVVGDCSCWSASPSSRSRSPRSETTAPDRGPAVDGLSRRSQRGGAPRSPR